MATYALNPGKGFVTGAASIPQYVLLKHDGTLTAANSTKDWIGWTLSPQATSGKPVSLQFPHAGTALLTAAGAISKGDIVYKDANGTVGTTNTNAAVGIALEAATAAGDYIEVSMY